MTAKDLKVWVDTLCPDAEIYINRYSWEELDHDKIMAKHESFPMPPNLEDAT